MEEIKEIVKKSFKEMYGSPYKLVLLKTRPTALQYTIIDDIEGQLVTFWISDRTIFDAQSVCGSILTNRYETKRWLEFVIHTESLLSAER